MKVLILSCSCGGGHDSAGKAVQQGFLQDGDECVFHDVLSFLSPHYSNLVCNSYVNLVKTAPKIFGKMYTKNEKRYKKWYAKKTRSVLYISHLLYANKLLKYIIEENFDTVVCTHFFAGQVLTHLKKHGKFNKPFFFVSTDYSCSPLLEEVNADTFFVPHADCIESFTTRGIDSQKLYVCGIPISQKFNKHIEKKEARAILNLPQESKYVLIMSGSMGFGSPISLIKKILLSTAEPVKIVLITGKNKRLYTKTKKAFSKNDNVVIIGFTDQIDLYMDACDIILTKPGGLSSTEALVKNVPILHTSPIPGCETENAMFFKNHNMALVAFKEKEISLLTQELITNQELQESIKESQRKNCFPDTANQIVKYIKNKIQSQSV